MATSVDLSVDHDAAAASRTHDHAKGILCSGGRSETGLGQYETVGVVLNGYGMIKHPFEIVLERFSNENSSVGVHDSACSWLHDSGDSDADGIVAAVREGPAFLY